MNTKDIRETRSLLKTLGDLAKPFEPIGHVKTLIETVALISVPVAVTSAYIRTIEKANDGRLALYLVAGMSAASLALSVVFSIYYLTRYKRTKRLLKLEKSQTDSFKIEKDVHDRISQIFAASSRENAICDKQIFDTLHLRFRQEKGHEQDLATQAADEMTMNIVQNLTFLRAIFKNTTGADCAVNVKIIRKSSKGPKGKRHRVETLCRDAESGLERESRNKIIKTINDDPAHSSIYDTGRRIYRCNDLRGEHFECPRPGWNKFYNSMIVCGIRYLPKRGESDSWIGFITVDSPSADFSSPQLDSYLIEFSNRIAALYHRIHSLSREYKIDIIRRQNG